MAKIPKCYMDREVVQFNTLHCTQLVDFAVDIVYTCEANTRFFIHYSRASFQYNFSVQLTSIFVDFCYMLSYAFHTFLLINTSIELARILDIHKKIPQSINGK